MNDRGIFQRLNKSVKAGKVSAIIGVGRRFAVGVERSQLGKNSEEKENLPLQNMSLRHKDYFGLIIF